MRIEDISRAFVVALEAPKEVGFNQAFNVGQTAPNYTIRQIAEIVGEVVPNCLLEIASDAGPDTRSYRVNFDNIARALPTFKPHGTRARAPSSFTPPTRSTASRWRSSRARASTASPT